jgi:hypothetical protein
VRTLGRAISLARAGSTRVYACAEPFIEAVEIPAGLELWGGLDCANGWVYAGSTEKTAVTPEPDLIPLRVMSGQGASVVADVRAEAAGATLPGGSAIAVMVMPGARVEIRRSELRAGDGAPGAAGEDGGEGSAATGAAGSPGVAACSEEVAPGGPAVQTTCDGVVTIGAEGGDGFASYGGDGDDGQPEPAPNPDDWGHGGPGASSGMQCNDGGRGRDGTDGAQGLGAVGPGRISLEGWRGREGQSGGDGLPGQGGGGGGASRGGLLLCGIGSGPTAGASGGGGGAGGCAGKGGKGGGHGGASIGLLSLSGDVAVRESVIVTGRGGDGGAGGLAQAGGIGGPGGDGGLGSGMASPGCRGGDGGKGGNGGYGGGGLGGPSMGIAYLLGQQPALERNTIEVGSPGQGGPGGNPAIPSSAGAGGFAVEITGFPLGGGQ